MLKHVFPAALLLAALAACAPVQQQNTNQPVAKYQDADAATTYARQGSDTGQQDWPANSTGGL